MRVAVPLELCWHRVPGGTARSALDLTSALVRRDDVEVVGVTAAHRSPPDPVWQPQVGLRSSRLPRLALYESWHRLRRPRIESVSGPVDLVHAVGGAVPGTREPLVVTVHDLAFIHRPEYFTPRGLRFFHRALAIAEAEAAQIQVPSLATLEDCVAHGIDRGRLHHVPWGCEPVDVREDQVAAVRARFGLLGSYVVSVSTLEPRKNLVTLLEAWRRMAVPDSHLVLVGPTGWGDVPNRSTFPENVTMTGFVDMATRDALYAGAAASCYPSVLEGFGLPVLESMAAGCPVVTSAHTATAELVTESSGRAVDVSDPDEIAAALEQLLRDPDHRADLAAGASRRASEFTWERSAALAVGGYRRCLR